MDADALDLAATTRPSASHGPLQRLCALWEGSTGVPAPESCAGKGPASCEGPASWLRCAESCGGSCPASASCGANLRVRGEGRGVSD